LRYGLEGFGFVAPEYQFMYPVSYVVLELGVAIGASYGDFGQRFWALHGSFFWHL
jgi:hypothetical protein